MDGDELAHCFYLNSLIAVITAPVVHFSGSIGRPGGLNEFEHLLNHLIQGNQWAIYESIC